ncbi:minor capsid protein [Subtercola endophyticus]|uniref:minor capsid protein n=1 Tax=Subtercola endophyticus TaxID=2895559 RepID=UPI001E5C529C|nr:minor capsid protein [Subtercola endophyticus]UFS59474.1 minor capsid protein [Subtercola endophyticus]
MSIEWEINVDFDGARKAMADALPIAVGRALEHIRAVSAPLVPVESGHLVGSASIVVNGEDGTITYPGPYALYQHEGVYYRHGRTGAPLRHTHGQSFFLQQPMVTEKDAVIQIIADTVNEAL